MSLEVKGRVAALAGEKTGVSSRGPWRKVFVIVEYEGGQYPKQILLSNMKDAEQFAKIRVGQTGTFKFDCTVRENNGNHYMDVNCWSWKIDETAPAPAQQDANDPF